MPDAEFDVMQIVWSQPSPVSSMQVAALAAPEKQWKPQTVLTLLARLTKRGFLLSEKQGWERVYTPLVSKEAYLNQETGDFVRKFHKDSLTGLMNALYADKSPGEEELAGLEKWLKERKEGERRAKP
ncbi:MAG: BlaI/MecI/CopY family transcriptional regulator [Defluviitaleaceae bacterium]|nr:BlaI/MecI/CopY family transcriptional regulator [Defluviitaleaceae bacterium]